MARHLAQHVTHSLWLLLQMVLAMHAGMALYHLLLHNVLAGTGYATLMHHRPLLDYWVTAASMVIPMVILMRVYHKNSWRACGEMTAVMLVPVVVLKVLVLGEVVPLQTFLKVDYPLMIVAMASYLLFTPPSHAPGRVGLPN